MTIHGDLYFEGKEFEIVLKEKGIHERCLTMVPVLNEDEIMAAYYENLITEVQAQEIISKIGLEINEAFVYAKESPFPESIEAYNGEYAI